MQGSSLLKLFHEFRAISTRRCLHGFSSSCSQCTGVAPSEINDMGPDVVPSSDDEALMPVNVPTRPTDRPTRHELSAQTVHRAHARQTYQVRLRRTRTDRGRKRARLSIYTLRDHRQRQESPSRQKAQGRLTRIHQVGISGHQVAACAHEIFVAARECEPPLTKACSFFGTLDFSSRDRRAQTHASSADRRSV